jgi:3-phenylpropionate/trans-cinnamate dioxygenase ferredoxin component
VQQLAHEFVRVAAVGDVPDPGKIVVEVEERMVALIHAGGQFYALDDVCTHDGGPLADGLLTDHALACPRHGAKFDIRTGKPLSMPATQATTVHETRVQDGSVFVRLHDA